jgi:hypothetical protein
MSAKQQLITLFRVHIKGKKPDLSGRNIKHDGREGQWLENQFGIHSNASNSADIMGYELKNETSSKTSFGDWSANEYIYNNPLYSSVFSDATPLKRRDKFLSIFGKPNIQKGGRCSWSGEPCPKIGTFNRFGQKLVVLSNNDIIALYCYSQDQRDNKSTVVPEILQKENIELARWYGNETPKGKKGKCLKDKVEDKFNDKGWFTCKKDSTGAYYKICFGNPMTFNAWIELVKRGIVFFDSGMYQGNKRPYSQWRAENNYWNSLIIEEFE